MNPENKSQQPDNQASVPPLKPGNGKVIQPTDSINQELQEQQLSTQPMLVSMQNQQQEPTSNPANIYPEPTAQSQMQVGMSASQLGLHDPKNKFFNFNPKQLIIKGSLLLLAFGGIFAILTMTNIITLSEFKTLNYENNGENYSLKFYSKHSSKTTKSGVNQLVSKISKGGKFPMNLSISGGNNGLSGYDLLKDCARFSKVIDIQNSNLNQKISVCDAVGGKSGSQNGEGKVYIAGFTHSDKVHIITISQDYSDIDLSSQSGGQESLTKFGLNVYEEDIKAIISSIKM